MGHTTPRHTSPILLSTSAARYGNFQPGTMGIAYTCRKGQKAGAQHSRNLDAQGEMDTAPNQDNFSLVEFKPLDTSKRFELKRRLKYLLKL